MLHEELTRISTDIVRAAEEAHIDHQNAIALEARLLGYETEGRLLRKDLVKLQRLNATTSFECANALREAQRLRSTIAELRHKLNSIYVHAVKIQSSDPESMPRLHSRFVFDMGKDLTGLLDPASLAQRVLRHASNATHSTIERIASQVDTRDSLMPSQMVDTEARHVAGVQVIPAYCRNLVNAASDSQLQHGQRQAPLHRKRSYDNVGVTDYTRSRIPGQQNTVHWPASLETREEPQPKPSDARVRIPPLQGMPISTNLGNAMSALEQDATDIETSSSDVTQDTCSPNSIPSV